MVRIAIFGAGIGGLTVAHHLAKLGYDIDIYDIKPHIGGLARSGVDPSPNPGSGTSPGSGCPTEYCWRVYFGFYANYFRILREIPTSTGSAINNLTVYKHINVGGSSDPPNTLLTTAAIIRGVLSCDERLDADDAKGLTWQDALHEYSFSSNTTPNLFKTVGPWLGADRIKCSYRSVIKVGIEQQIIPSYIATIPGSTPYRDYVTTAPSSDAIFDPWYTYLVSLGVNFHLGSGSALSGILVSGTTVTSVLASGKRVVADYVILALPVEILEKIIKVSPTINPDKFGLPAITTLTETCLHTQLSFQLYLNTPISFGGSNAFLLVDSAWDLIVLSYDQTYDSKNICDNDPDIKGVWSVAATTAYLPGSTGKTLSESTYPEIIAELWSQLYNNKKLQDLIRQHNDFRLTKDLVVKWAGMWPTFTTTTTSTGRSILTTTEPKFTNNAGSYSLRPSWKTYLPNLFISTAYVKETIDIFSMEAAALAGTMVAHSIDTQVLAGGQNRRDESRYATSDPRTPTPIHNPRPNWLAPFRGLDRVCWSLDLPNSMNTIVISMSIFIIMVLSRTKHGS